MQALSRVLREDGKRSIDLCTNIISVFFSLSNFSQFHPLIMEQQMGAKTVDIIDLEVKRADHRAKEEGISPGMVAQRAMEARMGKVKLQERERKMLGLVQKQDRLLYMSFYLLLNLAEDVTVERKMKKKNITLYLVKMLDRANVELLILVSTTLAGMQGEQREGESGEGGEGRREGAKKTEGGSQRRGREGRQRRGN